MSDTKIAVFYCGSQRGDWKCFNCDSCKKGYDEKESEWRCDLERKIDEAYIGDGYFDAATAKRMGQPEDCRVYNWRCPEYVEDTTPRPEPEPVRHALNKPADWIAEWAAKRGVTLT